MGTIELKPCPFCGSKAVFVENHVPDGKFSYNERYVSCVRCGCRTKAYITGGYYGINHTKADVAAIWNRRTGDD